PPSHFQLAPCGHAPHVNRFRGPGQDDAVDLATADQSVIPSEIVIEYQVEGRRLLRQQGAARAVLNLRFETATTEGTDDAAVGEEQRLGTLLLRAGAFDAGND